jgi:hypothetical protein
MPVGNYFWNSIGNGGATRTFLLELKNQLDTATGRTWTLTLDDTNDTSTGKVTISCSGAATTATWDAGGVIEAALGFTSNLSSGTTWTGANQAKYLWLPNCGRSGALSPQAGTGAARADYTAAVAPDGTPSILAYAKRSYDTFDFRTVLGSKMWTVKESTVNEALETYWRAVISIGMRSRFHADRSVDATYRTWIHLNGGEFNPAALDENWTDGANSLWSVRWDVGETS